ncbi:MAG: hypothetical protein AB8W37_02410 [Arsenophonus endosymbiont of Dermacentor nuttalli]
MEAKFNSPTFWQKLPLFVIKRANEKWSDECENCLAIIEKTSKTNKNYSIKIGLTFLLLMLFLFCYYVFSYEVKINKKTLFSGDVINNSPQFHCKQFLRKKDNIAKVVAEINRSIPNNENFYFHVLNHNGVSFIYQNKQIKRVVEELFSLYQSCQFNINAILLSDLINYVNN